MTRPQLASLVAGLAVTAIGVLLLLHAEGTIVPSGGWLAATLTGLAGGALVASGLGARDP